MRSTVILATLLCGMLVLVVQAQRIPIQSAPAPSSPEDVAAPAICTQPIAHDHFPDAPGEHTPEQQSVGSIHGTVTDPTGSVIPGARVALETNAKPQYTLLTDGSGFFNFTDLEPGTFRITITSKGFAPWVKSEIVVPSGENCELTRIALKISSVETDVEVVLSRHDLAEEQMRAEEKQRVLGVFPNFYTSYVWHAVPLTPKQKFRLALRTSIDPTSFVVPAVTAGIEQWQDYFSGYGQGSQGYAKRFAASYADFFIGTMIGGAVLPSVLHQDPRYFYKGTGSIRSRALYAISTVVICKGDNGRWQPNYSNVFGTLAAAGISNIYYPSTNREGAGVTVGNALIGTASDAINALLQEFLLRKISRGVHASPSVQP